MTAEKTPNEIKRNRALAARRRLTNEERRDASAKICDRFVHSREFMSCETLACYLPMDDEVDPTSIIGRAWRAKKRIFVPVCDTRGNMFFRQLQPETQISKSNFGLWEPVSGPSIDAKKIDIVVTPLVAFDDDLNRIGMGMGYFDRCFHFLRHRKKWLRPKLIGVAFDCQKVEKIVPNPWDIGLCRVITEIS